MLLYGGALGPLECVQGSVKWRPPLSISLLCGESAIGPTLLLSQGRVDT